MKRIALILFAVAAAPFLLTAQNVGVDVAIPTQKLDVAGALRIGSTTTGGAGSMRWNGTNFEVHDGVQWISFGTGTDNDWAISGVNMYSQVAGNIGIGTTTPATKLQVVGTARVDGLEMGTQYSFPTLDGTNGYVLTTDGSGNVTWSDPAAVGDITEVIAGDGLINGGTSGAVTLDVNPGDGIALFADEVRVRALDLEGDGLTVTSNNFDLNVDNTTVEVNADVLRVKADGITANEIATGAVTTTEILDGTIVTGDIATGGVTSTNILDGTVAPVDMASGANSTVLTTDGSGTVSWQLQNNLFGNQAGDGLVLDAPNSEIDVNPGDGIGINTDQVEVVATDLEGNGLVVTSNNFDVNVDNSTIEISADVVQVKPEGITANEIATGGVTTSEILDGTVTTTDIADGTILGADIDPSSTVNQVLATTVANTTVAWVDPATLTNSLQDGDADTKITVDVGGVDEDHIRMSTLGVERVTIDNTGQVGIGTITPARDLHIANDNGGTLVLTRNDNVAVTTGDVLGELMFDSEDDSGPSPTDASALIRGIASVNHGDSDKGGHMAFLTKTSSTDNTAVASERMRITSDGNVGIGTTTPGQALEVSGRIRVGSPQTEFYATATRMLVRSENTDNVAQFASYGIYLPQSATYGVYVGGGIQLDYNQAGYDLSFRGNSNHSIFMGGGSGTEHEMLRFQDGGTVMVPSLAGAGNDLVYADPSGNLLRSTFDISSTPQGTGITNYVTKWTGTTSLGATTTGARMGTSGTSSSTRTLTLHEGTDAQLNFGAYPGAWTSALQIQNNDNTDMIWISPLDNNNNARIRTGSTGLDFYVGGTNTSTGTLSTSMNTNGNVGIRTTASDYELMMAGWIGRTAHNNGGFVGSYNNLGDNSSYSDPIYVIGNSYKPGTTTIGNMYGIGYSHNNFWGSIAAGETGVTGWGMYVAADGDIRHILDASTGVSWASGSMRAPIFYDSNNTGYYTDPASTSRHNVNRNNYYDVEANNDYGIRFWNGSDSYKIQMGNDQQDYGWVTDYSMHFTMNNQSNRGFTWGYSDTQVSTSLSTAGNFRTRGVVYAENYLRSNTLTGTGNRKVYADANGILTIANSGNTAPGTANTLAPGASSYNVGANSGAVEVNNTLKTISVGTPSPIMLMANLTASNYTITFQQGAPSSQGGQNSGQASYELSLQVDPPGGIGWTNINQGTTIVGMQITDMLYVLNLHGHSSNDAGLNGDKFGFSGNVSLNMVYDPAAWGHPTTGSFRFRLVFQPRGFGKTGGNYRIYERQLSTVILN